MIVSDRARFVFVHNPKAGGTSIRRRLAPLDDATPPFWMFAFSLRLGRRIDRAHIPLDDVARAYPQTFDKILAYRSFTFVRNPYGRAVSAFGEWCVRTGRKRKLARPDWAIPRFRDYLAALDPVKVRSSPTWIHACPQHLFVFAQGRQACGRVGRTEELDTDFPEIARWIGLPETELVRHNRSRAEALDGWYDGPAARRVAEFYAADFEAFGYDRASL